MITSIISLIIALGILGVVYVLFKWIIGTVSLPAPLLQIANIVFGILAVIIVLKYLLTLVP